MSKKANLLRTLRESGSQEDIADPIVSKDNVDAVEHLKAGELWQLLPTSTKGLPFKVAAKTQEMKKEPPTIPLLQQIRPPRLL